jgi:hypothetical protein
MGRGRGSSRWALAGACSFGAGTVAFALCSPASTGCTTNLVVLTNAAVTTRSCAAYSVAAHLGIGLMVLGGVLLVGYFIIVAVRPRAGQPADAPAVRPPAADPVDAQPPAVEPALAPPPAAEPVDAPVPAAEPTVAPIALPPGWYGNPSNPDKPVQWWDGTKLTDAPPGPGE